jgi:hypothetical protein
MICSTIYRANSWSRMKITFDMFRMLCVSSCVTPQFLDLIRGMGYKSGPADEHFMSCYCYIHAGSGREENDRTIPIQGKDFTSGKACSLRFRFGISHGLPGTKISAIISVISKSMGVIFRTHGRAGSPLFTRNTHLVMQHQR